MSGSASVGRREFLGLLGGAAVYLVGCSSEATGPALPPPPPGGDVTVNMQNIAFVAPDGSDDVTIALGQSVEWVNLDMGIQHTATSTELPAGGNAFDSGLLNTNDTFVFVPNVTGTWVYFCEVHPNDMVGATITVT